MTSVSSPPTLPPRCSSATSTESFMCLPMIAGGPLSVVMKPIFSFCCAIAAGAKASAAAIRPVKMQRMDCLTADILPLFSLEDDARIAQALVDFKVLRLAAVTKRFGIRTVLNAVSLDLAAGEYVAVIGDSGIGKSTLLNVIAGLEPVDSGRIFFQETEITGLGDDEQTLLRREKFGFVFQAFHILPHLTVEQNVALPLLLRNMKQEERVKRIISSVGLAGREQSLPRELSGGELQRVAIARALVGEPKLVLADEPTGNLDPENARQVLALLRAQVNERGAAAILATHSEAAAADCDRRYRLSAEGLAPLG